MGSQCPECGELKIAWADELGICAECALEASMQRHVEPRTECANCERPLGPNDQKNGWHICLYCTG